MATKYGTALAFTLYGTGSDGSGTYLDAINQWAADTFGGTPTSAPVDGDDAIDDGTFTVGPPSMLTLNSLDTSAVSNNGIGVDQTPRDNISVTASLNFLNGSWKTDLSGSVNAVLYANVGFCQNDGNISGNAAVALTGSYYGVFTNNGNTTGGTVVLSGGQYGNRRKSRQPRSSHVSQWNRYG